MLGLSDDRLFAICALFNRTGALTKTEEEIDSRMFLDISKNDFSDLSFASLFEYLRQFQGLKELNLSGCNIETTGISSLSTALRVNCSLQYLDLRGIAIDEQGILGLLSSAEENIGLAAIKLSTGYIDLSRSAKLAQKLESRFLCRPFNKWNLKTLKSGLKIIIRNQR